MNSSDRATEAAGYVAGSGFEERQSAHAFVSARAQ